MLAGKWWGYLQLLPVSVESAIVNVLLKQHYQKGMVRKVIGNGIMKWSCENATVAGGGDLCVFENT